MPTKPRLFLISRDHGKFDYCENPSVKALGEELEAYAKQARLNHKNTLLCLNNPQTSAQIEDMQKVLRAEELELVELSSSIVCVAHDRHRQELQRTCDELLRSTADLDKRLGQERLVQVQKESKSPLTKLLFVAGFPAGIATATKALTGRAGVIVLCTTVAIGTALWVTYKDGIGRAWKNGSRDICKENKGRQHSALGMERGVERGCFNKGWSAASRFVGLVRRGLKKLQGQQKPKM